MVTNGVLCWQLSKEVFNVLATCVVSSDCGHWWIVVADMWGNAVNVGIKTQYLAWSGGGIWQIGRRPISWVLRKRGRGDGGECRQYLFVATTFNLHKLCKIDSELEEHRVYDVTAWCSLQGWYLRQKLFHRTFESSSWGTGPRTIRMIQKSMKQ